MNGEKAVKYKIKIMARNVEIQLPAINLKMASFRTFNR
jgi:hypothetical protein